MVHFSKFGLLAGACFTAQVLASPTIEVGLTTSFSAAPYLLELLETAGDENATSYFPLLDRIADGHFENHLNDKDLYEAFTRALQDDGHMDAETLSSFNLALSLRTTAPRIEAHYQYYHNSVEPILSEDDISCPVWILFEGKKYCSPTLDEAHGVLKGHHKYERLQFDRVIGNLSAPASVLYGDLTSPTFGHFHKILMRSALRGKTSYTVRHRKPLAGGSKALGVAGYGVELALKRTDYIVIDDREADVATDGDVSTGAKAVLEEDDVADLKPLSKAELRSLGVKAACFILESENPFQMLARISQDFPRYSSAIATHNVSAEFVLEHQHNRGQLVPAGMNVFWLNGIQISERQLDAFNLLELLRNERRFIRSFSALGPEGIYEEAALNIRLDAFNVWRSNYTAIELGDATTASIRIIATVDPASQASQRLIPILRVLSELDGVYMKLYLNPKDRLAEIPIKRFYRYVLDSKPSFESDGSLRSPAARFTNVPQEALLTVGMDVPGPWLVAPKESIHDLDNIKLSGAKGDVSALYELEHILIEGHSNDRTKKQAPRGAQLVLGTARDPHAADTIIMANLGYFQFKANPGYYKIGLQDGRSSEIFRIDTLGIPGRASIDESDKTEVALMSFQGVTLYPQLSRRPGQTTEDVLEPKAPSKRDWLTRGRKLAEEVLSLGKTTTSLQVKNADINIFSVASGHLYERMLNIMMVSVMKHTKHTVKFWFIEQFLSPSFKASIPTLAAEYGFQYEMVTYKWPHWLRAQSEKQREIWGYKILFLDVLFPLNLEKVIFVDADQIVRTDMMELVNTDLHGAPYGFTPMCDSRTEMEGFRFWKQGYWERFLNGLPYHISALYVVDLRRFRAIAAGDRLRQQYHQLSADPESLSNLDQDLPNHMQEWIPIFSLPQEWLWCETWCSDESLLTAKTIDLCNNPLTKEPKLDRARRQVPEWTVYDEEIAAVLARRKTGEDLIGEGSGSAVSEEKEYTKDEL